jgi:predicted unusual protein kinase regulating ubiquinone biosynthesis (AarF/ABC1/UbiB family)
VLKPSHFGRLGDVAAVFLRHGFEDVLDTFGLLSWRDRRRRRLRKPKERARGRARKLRLALEELGTAYIKLGQVLSTRPDLLPAAFTEELSRLQDRVEPVGFGEVETLLEEELGRPIDEVFEKFDRIPVASASIAQVYRARVRPEITAFQGDVAVKVVKPGVPQLVAIDVEILHELAERLHKTAIGRRYDVRGIAEQLEKTLLAELDLTQEASNTRRLAKGIREFPVLRTPTIVDELVTRRVLVLEYVEGQKVMDLSEDLAAGLPREKRKSLAESLWRLYLKQILVDGAFHCDPHPGNFLIDASGRLVPLDYGMIAHISRENQLRLMALLLTLVDRDGERTAKACIEMGIPGRSFRGDRFGAEVGLLVARYASVPIKEMPLGIIFRDLVTLCLRNDIQIPPEMLLLGKTLLNLEPICRKLDPEMNPVGIMQEMAARLLQEQLRREFSSERLMSLLLELRAFLNEVPLSARRALTHLANNELRIGIEMERAEQLQNAVRDVANRITLGVITAALILGSAFLLNVDAGYKIFGSPAFSLVGFLLAAGIGIYVVVKILVSRG